MLTPCCLAFSKTKLASFTPSEQLVCICKSQTISFKSFSFSKPFHIDILTRKYFQVNLLEQCNIIKNKYASKKQQKNNKTIEETHETIIDPSSTEDQDHPETRN